MSSKTVRVRAYLTTVILAAAALLVSAPARTFADGHDNVKKAQEALRDKGYAPGSVDGAMGDRTRDAIRHYQRAENLPVTGHLDKETSERLGVDQESVGGEFKSAGNEVGRGAEGVGHEIKKGKPVAAGKDLGEGVGKGGKKAGEGVKKAVSPQTDSNDPEKKP